MKYQHILKGTFLSRPNRFIAHVRLDGENGREVVCHVKNTGRCRELLLPGVGVLVEFHPDAASLGRKTEYSLIGVYKERDQETFLINMDSQAPNRVAAEWLDSMRLAPVLPFSQHSAGNEPVELSNIRREVTYGNSRFDLAFDITGKAAPVFSSAGGAAGCETVLRLPSIRHAFMEVKGVTLEENGIAMFPDAPTERGIKHILELAEAVKAGYEAYILFVIQMKGILSFTPNRKTHPQFGDALSMAGDAGVHILAYDCLVTEDTLAVDAPVPVSLSLSI